MPVPSQPPPSEKIPEKSGGGLYLIGAVALVGAAVALYFWKQPSTPPSTPQTSAISAPPPQPEAPVAQFAPPPPPKLDDEPDAGVDAGKSPVKTATGTPPPGPCAGSCGGPGTPAMKSALSGRAQSARGCYNRALRTSEVSGSMTVRVQVGPSGQVCSASITSDTVHSNEVSSCVLGRFRGQSFPAPGECATVDIPIAFTIKQ